MERKLELYNRYTHILALIQLQEKMSLELEYDNSMDLEDLKECCRGNYCFSEEEYQRVYNVCKKIHKKTNYNKYTDIIGCLKKY